MKIIMPPGHSLEQSGYLERFGECLVPVPKPWAAARSLFRQAAQVSP